MINKADYEYWGQWKQPVLSCWFWMEWQDTQSLRDINAYSITLHPMLYLDGHFWYRATHRSEFKKMAEKIIEEERSEEYLALFNTTLQKYKNEYLALLTTPLEPHEYVTHLFDASRNMAAVWIWAMFVADELAKVIVESGIVASEEELVERTHRITPMAWLEKQSVEVRELANLAGSFGVETVTISTLEKYPELGTRIREHVQEFSWFGSHHWVGEGYTLEECLDQINEAIQSPKDIHTKEIVIGDEHPAIRLVASGVFWRTHAAEVTAKVVYESRSKLEALGKLTGLTYDELVYLSGPEVSALNEDTDSALLKASIAERKEGYGCIVDDSGIHLVTGDVLTSLLAQMLSAPADQVTEFKGSVASKGPVISGIARVVLSPDDFNKLQDGDILVVPETTPDYVPLMKRASAVITDVGGITSHAAIISRELKKPCVIGTKIGTQVLHDGDLVEVDAERGIVRVLKKAE